MFLLLLTQFATQLGTADIRIRLGPEPETAMLEARYIMGAADSARFTLIRLPGQSVEIEPDDLVVEQTDGSLRFTAPLVGERGVALRLTIRGDIERIPIPVPEAPTVPGRKMVRIGVIGLDPAARLDQAFPRLDRPSGMVARATLANVPSLLRLPPTGGALSVPRVVEWLVVLLVVGATGGWLLHRRRRSA